MSSAYAPKRGDLVWLDFAPQTGREQAGRRPALVVSDDSYNSKVGLALVCPVTSREKGYPFEVKLPDAAGVAGVVLSDQVRSLDWRARRAAYIGSAGHPSLEEALGKIRALLGDR